MKINVFDYTVVFITRATSCLKCIRKVF